VPKSGPGSQTPQQECMNAWIEPVTLTVTWFFYIYKWHISEQYWLLLNSVNSFSAMSLTLAINFRLFGYFDQFQRHRHRGTTPSTHCCDDKDISGRRGRTRPPMLLCYVTIIYSRNSFQLQHIARIHFHFIQNQTFPFIERTWQIFHTAYVVIGTAMKICFHRHLTHSDQRPLRLLRPLKLVQTKTAIFPAAE
jgi:hypothetical protein